MEVKSQSLRKDSSFGFTFKTRQQDALIVISTFIGKASGDLADYFSVSLTGGHVSLVFGSGSDLKKRSSFVTEKSYNDGQYHTLFVVKRGRKISVFVDDLQEDRGDVLVSTEAVEMSSPRHGGLFLGGVPSVIRADVINSKMAASVNSLIGTIQDFLFIDDTTVRVVALNEPLSFFNVAIGRTHI